MGFDFKKKKLDLGLVFAVKIIVVGTEIEFVGNLRDVERLNRVGYVYVSWDWRHHLQFPHCLRRTHFSMNSVSGFQLFCWDFYFLVRVFKINESPSLTLSQKSLFLFIKKIKNKKSLCFLL